jgi:hypothetical protein
MYLYNMVFNIWRGMNYELYWVYSAREIEENHLAPLVTTLSRGGDYSEGREVVIKIKQCGQITEKKLKLTPNIKIRTLTYLLIGGFSLVYYIMIIISIIQLV